jgi:hypothetical protein
MHERCRQMGSAVPLQWHSAVAESHTISKALKWFFAGTLAVPLFHQSVLYVLHRIAFTTRAPFMMEPTAPLGVPQTFSLAFWGGVWGLILGIVLARVRGTAYFVVACLFGAILPTVVAVLFVAPLKGQPAPPDARSWLVIVLLNTAWGFGTAALAKIMDQK